MPEPSSSRPATVLITGASLGIGRELARVFAAEGHDLVLASRNAAKLGALAEEIRESRGVGVTVLPTDLTDLTAIRRLVGEIERRGIHIGILVNNAGVGHFKRFVETDEADHLECLALNVMAVVALSRRLLPGMLDAGGGRILNVASVAAFQPTPMMAVYGATKAFVLSLTEALAVELQGTGVTVTALCPGFTDTELVRHIADESGDPHMVPDFLMLDPVEVAREAYEACMAGRTIQVNGLTYRLALMWESWQPRWVVRRFGDAVSRWLGSGGTAT